MNTNAEEELKRLRIKQNTISRKLAMEIFETNEAFRTDPRKRHFFLYLARGYHIIDQRTGLIATPYEVVAAIIGEDPEHCQTGRFFREYKKAAPGFDYQEYNSQKNLCRQIISTGIEHQVEENYSVQNRIYVETWKAVTRKSRMEATATMKRVAKRLVFPCKDSEFIAHYHLGQSLVDFLDPLEQNLEAAIKVAKTKSPQQLALLLSTLDSALPIYRPASLSSRVFAEGVQFFEKTVRKTSYPDWIDGDLVSCQLAVAASKLDIPTIREFLLSGKPVWKTFMDGMGIPEEKQAEAKPFVKIALYSIIFGKRKDRDERDLETELRTHKIPFAVRFIDLPLIQDLIAAIRKAKQLIERDGGMQGAHGWLPVRAFKSADSHLATVIQSYETALIVPIYKLAVKEKKSNNATFDIMLNQHDGVSIKLRPGANKDKVLARIKTVVEKRAEELDIPTSWVWDL